MSDVIHVYKNNHTSQPMWNIRISYFFINKRANLFADIMSSNFVELFMNFWTELRSEKRETERGYITVFRGTFIFDNFYSNYHIEANQVNFSPFFRFVPRTPGLYFSRSVPPNMDLGTVVMWGHKKHMSIIQSKSEWPFASILLDICVQPFMFF